MDKDLTPEQSLATIEAMIAEARGIGRLHFETRVQVALKE